MPQFIMKNHLSDEAKRRGEDSLMDIIQQFSGKEGVVGMHGGLPPAATFPVKSLSFTHINPSASRTPTSESSHTALDTFQQYNTEFSGYPPLRQWLRELMVRMHKPAREADMGVFVGNGALHSLECIFRTLLNTGDSILVEEYTFSQVLEGMTTPFGYKPIGVSMDARGMLPEALERSIKEATAAGKPPRVLYTIPNGQNPTGAHLSFDRKRAIYDICSRYDIAIIEDDPYIYLQYGHPDEDVPGIEVDPGFLHFDVDGRVLRIDTFSKCFAPGLRLGWITTRAANLPAILSAIITPTMGPSGPSQLIAHSILSSWGIDGFHRHMQDLQRRYRASAECLQEALRQHCGALASWSPPRGGMFLWVRLAACDDVKADLMEHLVKEKVVIVPGRVFHVRGRDKAFKCEYARLAFAMCGDEALEEGARRLGIVLRTASEHKVAKTTPASKKRCRCDAASIVAHRLPAEEDPLCPT